MPLLLLLRPQNLPNKIAAYIAGKRGLNEPPFLFLENCLAYAEPTRNYRVDKVEYKGKESPLAFENAQFVKDLVNGGIAATTSIKGFNAQSRRSLLFFGREKNTASFIDVESSLYEAMAQDAMMQGISAERIVRVHPRGGDWNRNSCLKEPAWDYSQSRFLNGKVRPAIDPLIFSAGGVGNTTEIMKPWPESLQVRPGMVACR